MVTTIREERVSRAQSYKLLSDLRKQKVLPGMGPAYFTKLIFFLRGARKEGTGYIMDQWTGCSINLLAAGSPPVLMNAAYTWASPRRFSADFRVSELNDEIRYERFCSGLDKIAEELSMSQIDAELLLMSAGRGKGAWRSYVKKHRCVPDVMHDGRT